MKSDLSSRPNIGKTLEKKLNGIGIHDVNELAKAGSKNAYLQIKSIDGDACYNMLCALEGAIQNIRWHDLSKSDKLDLKTFYESVK